MPKVRGCPECDGKGEINGEDCPVCLGNGADPFELGEDLDPDFLNRQNVGYEFLDGAGSEEGSADRSNEQFR